MVFPPERRKANDHRSFHRSLIHIAKLLDILLPSPLFQNKLAQICLFFFSKLWFLKLYFILPSSCTFHSQCCKSFPARVHCHQQIRITLCVLVKNNTEQTYNNGWIICIHAEEEKGKLLVVFRREQGTFELAWVQSVCISSWLGESHGHLRGILLHGKTYKDQI